MRHVTFSISYLSLPFRWNKTLSHSISNQCFIFSGLLCPLLDNTEYLSSTLCSEAFDSFTKDKYRQNKVLIIVFLMWLICSTCVQINMKYRYSPYVLRLCITFHILHSNCSDLQWGNRSERAPLTNENHFQLCGHNTHTYDIQYCANAFGLCKVCFSTIVWWPYIFISHFLSSCYHKDHS